MSSDSNGYVEIRGSAYSQDVSDVVINYGDNPTDNDVVSEQIPVFDGETNTWKIRNGFFYNCITMNSSGYKITDYEGPQQ